MNENLYRAISLWIEKYDKEHCRVELLKQELDEKNKKILTLEDEIRKLRGDDK